MPEGRQSAFRVTASGSVQSWPRCGQPVHRRSFKRCCQGYLENQFDENVNFDNYYTKSEVDQLDSLSMKRYGNNDVATAENEANIFRIRGIKEAGKLFSTYISINNEGMGLQRPRAARDPSRSEQAIRRPDG